VNGAARVAPALLLLAIAPSVRAEPPKIEDPGGTKITVTSDHTDTEIWVAKGPVPRHHEIDTFEKIGIAPLELKLAPGIYTFETEGPTQSAGHELVTVDRWPMDVKVKTGDASVKTIGTILIALGVVSIIGGIVVVATFGQGDKQFDKFTIAVPLLAAGAGVAGIGIGMSFLGATNVAATTPPTSPTPPPAKAAGANVFLRF
jgi:hypothetical protein